MKTQYTWKEFNKFKTLLASVCLSLMLMSCSSTMVSQALADANDPAVLKKFEKEVTMIAKTAGADPSYKRIPLDSKEDQTWFTSLAFLLWDNKSTPDDFINEGVKRFPDYKASFQYIAEKIKAIQ